MSAGEDTSTEENEESFHSANAIQSLCEMEAFPIREWEKLLEDQLHDVFREIRDIECCMKNVLSNVKKRVQIYAESASNEVVADLLLKTKDALFLLKKAREQLNATFEVKDTLFSVDEIISDLQKLADKLNTN